MVNTRNTPPRGGLSRLWYVYSWRVRFWWLDTPAGDMARRGTALLLALAGLAWAIAQLLVPPPALDATAPRQAFYWWVQLAIMVVSMIVSALLTKTDQTKPEVQTPDIPTTEEGTAIKRIYGTVRISEPQVLAWQSAGTTPIKAKGGKK